MISFSIPLDLQCTLCLSCRCYHINTPLAFTRRQPTFWPKCTCLHLCASCFFLSFDLTSDLAYQCLGTHASSIHLSSSFIFIFISFVFAECLVLYPLPLSSCSQQRLACTSLSLSTLSQSIASESPSYLLPYSYECMTAEDFLSFVVSPNYTIPSHALGSSRM